MLDAAPAELVNEKLAVATTPDTDPVTVYEPAVVLAVNAAEVATPEALVTAVVAPPEKTAVAPLPGAVNVTVTPLTGLLKESLTVACSCDAKAVLTVALCGVPDVTTMPAGMPAPPVPLAALKAARIAPQLLEGLSVAEAEAVPAVDRI